MVHSIYILYSKYYILYTLHCIYGGLQRNSVYLTENIYIKVYIRESIAPYPI